MQWSTPEPDNPWPNDMLIRVNDDPHNLTLLLFVRQAWSIAGDLNIPPLSPVPGCGHSRMPESADASTWGRRWKTSWDQAWGWYQIEDPTHHPTPAEMRESGDTTNSPTCRGSSAFQARDSDPSGRGADDGCVQDAIVEGFRRRARVRC